MTDLSTAIATATDVLAAAGVATPRVDAELLAAAAIGCPRSQLWQHRDQPMPEQFDRWVTARAARTPLQHLTGEAWFRHSRLLVGPGVFVPRPETEVLVGHVLTELSAVARAGQVTVVDLCAGSGTIGVALVDEAPVDLRLEVHAVEDDPDAVAWLQRNARPRGIVCHAASIQDVPTRLAALLGRVDVVTANPPYIPVDAVPRDPEVAEHDPTHALYSGIDGLDHLRVIADVAARLLRGGGALAVEHSDAHGVSAPAVLQADPRWEAVRDHPDLTGRDRFVTARRAGG